MTAYALKNNVSARVHSVAPNVRTVSRFNLHRLILTVNLALTIESQTPYLSAAIFIFLSFTFGLTCIGVCQYIVDVNGLNEETPGYVSDAGGAYFCCRKIRTEITHALTHCSLRLNIYINNPSMF